MKKAIVTLAIGTKYENAFNAYSRHSWQTYCEKFGYDLIVIKEALDETDRATKRSPAWQKLLILSQEWAQKYDRIAWLDSDIIINNYQATDICEGIPVHKIGAVDTYAIPTRELHDIALQSLQKYWEENNCPYVDALNPSEYYTKRGIPGHDLDAVVQTGVIVCSPKHHRNVFELVYRSYEDSHGAEWNYEMPALSYELLRSDLVHWLSPRYNFCVAMLLSAFYPEAQRTLSQRPTVLTRITAKLAPSRIDQVSPKLLQALKNIYDLSIFMHFAGCASLIALVKRALERSRPPQVGLANPGPGPTLRG